MAEYNVRTQINPQAPTVGNQHEQKRVYAALENPLVGRAGDQITVQYEPLRQH